MEFLKKLFASILAFFFKSVDVLEDVETGEPMTILEFFGLCSLLSMGFVLGVLFTMIAVNIIFSIPFIVGFRRNKKHKLT